MTTCTDETLYAIYFDYTGYCNISGRGPEVIAGPFKTEEEADEYATETGLKGDDYFNGEYFSEYDH